MRFLSIAASALLYGLSAAAPTSQVVHSLQARAPATCGNNDYTSAQVNQAAQKACTLFRAGEQIGSNDYPHRFNNREGFDFNGLSGPFQEFPIMASGSVYSGGSPGPDRVVITESCQQAGVITHTGASGNNFVPCEGGRGQDSRPGNGSGRDDDNDDNNDDDDDDDESGAKGIGSCGALLGAGLTLAVLAL